MKNMIRLDLGDLGFEVFELFSHYFQSVFYEFLIILSPIPTNGYTGGHRELAKRLVGAVLRSCHENPLIKYQWGTWKRYESSFRDFMGI